MAITNGYTTIEELKHRIGRINDEIDDATFESIITAASREIDGLTGRRFYQTTETRYFSPTLGDIVVTGDLVSISALTSDPYGNRTYDYAWLPTDYDFEPGTAQYQGMPYTAIRIATLGRYTFAQSARSVRIDGVWGWSEVPAAIREACNLIGVRLFMRSKAPFGIAGSLAEGQTGYIPRTDPDVKLLLTPFYWQDAWVF